PTSPRKRGEEQALPPRPRAESGPSPAESSPLPRLRGRVGVGAAPHSNTTCAAARRTAHCPGRGPATAGRCALFATVAHVGPGAALAWLRSEEHTSELQSRENLVCRLLLEKKKNTL